MSAPETDERAEIGHLVSRLSSKDMFERMEARSKLVEIGANVVPVISTLADSPHPQVRWECAKALAAIADASAVDTLIRLLVDSDEGTRWDAALGLIAVGNIIFKPVAQKIFEYFFGFRGAAFKQMTDRRNTAVQRHFF